MWFLLPCLLLLALLGVSFLNPSPLTAYIPLLATLGLCLTIRLRFVGLLAACSLLAISGALFLSRDVVMWQGGLLVTLALTYYIALFAFEEIERRWAQMRDDSAAHQKERDLLQEVQRESEKQWSDTVAELQNELERWKEEAESRRIARSEDEKKIALIQSEIELLTAQKEEILMLAATGGVAGQYKQLRAQFEEKACTLVKTRQELFAAEGKLFASELEKREQALAPPSEEVVCLLGAIDALLIENAYLDETLLALEQSIAQQPNLSPSPMV